MEIKEIEMVTAMIQAPAMEMATSSVTVSLYIPMMPFSLLG